MSRDILTYTKDNLTVVWKPKLCIHSAICFKGLPLVFKPKDRPWVDLNGADADAVIEQVKRCPTGALSIGLAEPEPTPLNTAPTPAAESVHLQLLPNGPLLIKGKAVLQHTDGHTEEVASNVALCRCGASGNKPYCDGSHSRIRFAG